MNAKELAEKLGGLVYPDRIYCVSCGHPIDPGMPYGLCKTCRERFSFASDGHKPSGFHATWYTLWEKELVLRFKYANRAWYAGPMAEMMADMLFMYAREATAGADRTAEAENADDPSGRNGKAAKDGTVATLAPFFDGIVAVPLHETRYRKRGYNQAELLARELSERIGVPYVADALLRVKKTAPLKTLSETERREELKGVFGPGTSDVAGKRLILVDDILTTGATAGACSDILRGMGAKSVKTVAFTATARDRKNAVIDGFTDEEPPDAQADGM